jgi:hypothetical protein
MLNELSERDRGPGHEREHGDEHERQRDPNPDVDYGLVEAVVGPLGEGNFGTNDMDDREYCDKEAEAEEEPPDGSLEGCLASHPHPEAEEARDEDEVGEETDDVDRSRDPPDQRKLDVQAQEAREKEPPRAERLSERSDLPPDHLCLTPPPDLCYRSLLAFPGESRICSRVRLKLQFLERKVGSSAGFNGCSSLV